MGTRHLIIIYQDGKYKLAQYGQWDGYPEGQGVAVLKFLSEPNNLTKLVANLDKLYTPTKEELTDIDLKTQDLRREARERMDQIDQGKIQLPEEEVKQILNQEMSALNFVCPSLSRDTGARILDVIANSDKPIPVEFDLQFTQSMLCEWVYVVDVDAAVLEVYNGLGWKTEGGTRFDKLDFGEDLHKPSLDDAEGLGLIAQWPLNNLPSESDFLRYIAQVMGDGET
ncbi:hypothetical protein VP1G_09557 [Cytospora mali]|uniref:Uncharacterized protein n=1 Tax=Cytospora mali TaxID=578113 RepID=A0A194VEK2_CYTMA|nr:hypothetical protein VP1G_09557 [Valsa mali var. pyri (nom. inval.)]